MATTTLSSGGLSVDTRDFQKFAKALRKAQPLLATKMRVKLREAGQLVADKAKENVAPFSTSIPPRIKVRTSGVTVSVIATGDLAGLFELGNKGGSASGEFRHPLFGNMNVWYAQPMHPFLGKALEEKSEEAVELILEALTEAMEFVVVDTEAEAA
jgi:hypothetical protein